MNNKILAALALTTALATGLQAQCQINSGAYVGLSLGGSHLGGKNDFNHTNTAVGLPQDSLKLGMSKTSLAAALFGGYGLKFNNLWAAVEAFCQFDDLKDKTTFRILSFQKDKKFEVNSRGAFGGAIHLGYIPNNSCIIYAIIGFEVRKFKVKFSDDSSPIDIAATLGKSYTSTAFTPGIGSRFTLSKNFSLRTEYKYVMHRNKSFNVSQDNAGAGHRDTIDVKVKPHVHTFSVGLVYNF
jgi:opacity protein-like surface antigen